MSEMQALDRYDATQVPKIGDRFDWGGPVLVAEGVARWHCVLCPPLDEARLVKVLARHGVYAFFAAEAKVMRRNGKRIPYERAFLPGYVFARFKGPVAVHRVKALPFCKDIMRLPSDPRRLAVLNPDDLAGLHAMRSRSIHLSEDAAEAERRFKARNRPRRGGKARMLSGGFAGKVVDVLEVTGDRMTFRFDLFGKAMEIESDVEAAVAVEG